MRRTCGILLAFCAIVGSGVTEAAEGPNVVRFGVAYVAPTGDVSGPVSISGDLGDGTMLAFEGTLTLEPQPEVALFFAYERRFSDLLGAEIGVWIANHDVDGRLNGTYWLLDSGSGMLLETGPLDFTEKYGWGSDLYQIWGTNSLKRNELKSYYQQFDAIKRANLITVFNYEMERTVIAKYGPEMQNKIVRALIGIRDDIFESIDKAKKNNPDPAFISTFNIPPNKIKITIGYCGDPICNHILILNELEKIDTDIKNKIHLLVPMTYGYFSQEYMDEVKEKLNYSMISYTIFDKYLPLEEVVQLRVISDVMIMMNMSDALSNSVCEAIYADNILISAIWLPYSPLRLEKIFFFETDFLNLSKTVIDVLDNFSEFKLKSIKNAERIKKLVRRPSSMATSSRPIFRTATVITLFLLPELNVKLRPKILDMKPGTRVVSNSFTMGDWKSHETESAKGDCTSYCTDYMWIVPATWRASGSPATASSSWRKNSRWCRARSTAAASCRTCRTAVCAATRSALPPATDVMPARSAGIVSRVR